MTGNGMLPFGVDEMPGTWGGWSERMLRIMGAAILEASVPRYVHGEGDVLRVSPKTVAAWAAEMERLDADTRAWCEPHYARLIGAFKLAWPAMHAEGYVGAWRVPAGEYPECIVTLARIVPQLSTSEELPEAIIAMARLVKEQLGDQDDALAGGFDGPWDGPTDPDAPLVFDPYGREYVWKRLEEADGSYQRDWYVPHGGDQALEELEAEAAAMFARRAWELHHQWCLRWEPARRWRCRCDACWQWRNQGVAP